MRVYNEGFLDVREMAMTHLEHLPEDLRRLRWNLVSSQLVDTVTRLADSADPTPKEIKQ